MTMLTAGGLTDPGHPYLPATASNVCTTDVRLGGVGRVPPPKQKAWLRRGHYYKVAEHSLSEGQLVYGNVYVARIFFTDRQTDRQNAFI